MEEQVPTNLNFNRLKKGEMLWLFNHRCQAHGHRYTEHPQCFDADLGKDYLTEKVGFLDIEATNLAASFGYVICYSLKELDGELKHRAVRPEEIRERFIFDKKVLMQFLKDIFPFDRLVGYYSKDYRFDVPFLRTRALRWGLDFPEWREYTFTDVYDIAKAKLKLHSTRMENVADLLGIPSKQHRLDPDIWMKAQAGDQNAIDYIQVHCDEDVVTLEAIYKKLYLYGGSLRASI